MAISDKLTQLQNVKQAIKTAISNKGVNMYNVPFTSYANKIAEIKTGSGNATTSDVLSGKTFSSNYGTDLVGTMPNRGAVSKTFTPSDAIQEYTIPQGYHNGNGKVTVNPIPSSYGQVILDPAKNIDLTGGWKVVSKVTGTNTATKNPDGTYQLKSQGGSEAQGTNCKFGITNSYSGILCIECIVKSSDTSITVRNNNTKQPLYSMSKPSINLTSYICISNENFLQFTATGPLVEMQVTKMWLFEK